MIRALRAAPVTALLATPLVLILGGCDNPACVFGPNGCQEGGGGGGGSGLGALPASVPLDGSWIAPGGPSVTSMAPTGTDAHPSTPVVITFSESLSADSLAGAFEMFEEAFGTPAPILEPPQVVGDGRMVVLSPLTPLQLGSTYVVRFADGAQVTDLTGQVFERGASAEIGRFGVAASAPQIPLVIATFPGDLSIDQSDIGEIVAVFDRPMDPASFDTASWAVTVDGLTPTENPNPLPLTILGGPFPLTINSVWRWASVDSAGRRVSLGPGGELLLELSHDTDTLSDPSGNVLPPTILEYTLAAIGAPVTSMKGLLSEPDDAIGRPNLEDVVPVLQVELGADALAGDALELFLFGQDPGEDATLSALSRTVEVTSPTMLVDVLPDRLDLLQGGVGSAGRFRDGDLHVAVRMRRGGVVSALRMTDVDTASGGVQPLRFDVTAPTVLGLGTSGSSTASYASDLRDLVVIGRADEEIGRVDVSTDGGLDNGLQPRAIMADAAGLFVAAPVTGVGVVDESGPPIQYTVRVFDRALNPQIGSLLGTFRQLGAVGPGNPLPGGTVRVTVFDSASLTLLSGALVMSHQDDAGAVTELEARLTDAGGQADVLAAASGETLVTVDLAGYDLFTFHGVPRDVLQVPLRLTNLANGRTEGDVTSPFPAVNFTTLTNQIGDSRRGTARSRLYDVQTCSVQSNLQYSCPFGPSVVQPNRLGGQCFLSADFNLTIGSFSPAGFLRAFQERLPAPRVAPGTTELGVEIHVPRLLASAPAEDQPIAMPSQLLRGAVAVNLGTLDGDPRITVEAVSPGLPGSLPVGLGVPFPTGNPDEWLVLGAYPGVVDGIDDGNGDLLGELVTRGTLQADLLVRAELVDTEGNRVGSRPRFSDATGVLLPPDIPRFLSPGPGGSSGGVSYDLVVADVVRDALGLPAMVRAVLTDSSGRRWILWHADTPDAAGDVRIHVPAIAGLGGTPLTSGAMTCRVSLFASRTLDLGEFLWTDLEREHELFGHTTQVPFTQD